MKDSFRGLIGTTISGLLLVLSTPSFANKVTSESELNATAVIHMPSAVDGKKYFRNINVQGGKPPYWVRSMDGTIESLGLTINDNGVISGTPTRSGTVRFTVTAKDSLKTLQATQTFQIKVLASVPEKQIREKRR